MDKITLPRAMRMKSTDACSGAFQLRIVTKKKLEHCYDTSYYMETTRYICRLQSKLRSAVTYNY